MRPDSRPVIRAFTGFHHGLRPLNSQSFQAGDHVVLRALKDRNASPLFCRNLKAGGRLDSHKGSISHADIIGKDARDIIRTKLKSGRGDGTEYRLYHVKLEEYVRWTKRLVTPLYPQDAQLIVGLLDLHVEAPRWGGINNGDNLELLEAGTGHGSLTLYLSRAIHAANTPMPRGLVGAASEEDYLALQQWKAARRAIIHSIELSPKYSAHARKVVRGFRQGMYYANVDFHVGSVGAWVRQAIEERNGAPWLAHAFLDLPGAESHIDVVADALKSDGTVIVFNPSITQIMETFAKVKQLNLALELEQVIELGVNGGSGGRQWDVRAVKPRITQKNVAMASVPPTGGSEASAEVLAAGDVEVDAAVDSGVEIGKDEEQTLVESKDTDASNWKMVCRPKVGDSVVGGGFLGVFRKHKPRLGAT